MSDVTKSGMTAERFAALLAHQNWQTTDDMVATLNAAGYWDEDELHAAAVERFKREHCRRMARTLRRDDGRHVFVHVIRTSPDGTKANVYKQQALFDVNDYRYAVTYHKQMGIHHMVRANELARDCRTFVGKQLPLPFPDIAA